MRICSGVIIVGLRERTAAKTRQRITEAADQEFKANGFKATTMQAIAERAGVSLRTLYNFYPRKSELFLHDFAFHLGILRAASQASSELSAVAAVAAHLAPGGSKTDSMADITVHAFDMLLWERLEEGLADIIRHRTDRRRDALEARTEAALAVLLIKSMTWPAYDEAVMKSGLDRRRWLSDLARVLEKAASDI